MVIRACAFTNEGWTLIDRLETEMSSHLWDRRLADEGLDDWVREGFYYGAPIVFVGAVPIAVRLIAPCIDSKLTDSPVLVVDERGEYVIPLLSNHLGGANELAKQLAEITCGQVVITTSTDVNSAFAVDVFARKNGLRVGNKDGIKKVSSKVLKAGRIKIAIDSKVQYKLEDVPESIDIVEACKKQSEGALRPDAVIIDIREVGKNEVTVKPENSEVLQLIFKPYVLGIGCKKGTSFERLNEFVTQELKAHKIDIDMVSGMASIDLKAKEQGLLYFSAKHRIPFFTYTADELSKVEGEFSDSDFVKSITGVSNVCERAATKLAGEGGQLLVNKVARDGMTLAVCQREARIQTWEA